MSDFSARRLRANAKASPSAAAFGRRIRAKGAHLADSEVRAIWKRAHPLMVYVGTVKAPEGLVTPNARDGVIHIQFKTRKMLTKKQAISRATKMLKGYKDAYVQRSLKDIQDPVSGQFKSLLPDIEWWVNGVSGLEPQPEGRFVPGRKAR